MIKDGISRTSRLLTLYYLFENCREVSIYEMVPKISEQTFFDDVQLLRDAGVIKAKYDEEEKSFYPEWKMQDAPFEPNYPEDETQRAYIDKIRRLCILMKNLNYYEGEEEPLHIDQYKELFPDESDETRERDFDELAKLGIAGHRYLSDDDDDGEEKWLYDFDISSDPYDLDTIEEMEIPKSSG